MTPTVARAFLVRVVRGPAGTHVRVLDLKRAERPAELRCVRDLVRWLLEAGRGGLR